MIHHGDCLAVLPTLEADSFDACVTDPPYHLTSGKKGGSGIASINLASPYGRARIGTGNGSGGFMGKAWDGGEVAFDPETWYEVYRVLKPGAHLLAMGGTRTYHRLVCAIEDAGFEIRDTLSWNYGSGFPKSKNVSADPMFCQCRDAVPYNHADSELHSVCEAVSHAAVASSASDRTDLFAPVQRSESRAGLGDARKQGTTRMDDGAAPTVRPREPGVEGRRDLLQDARQLHRSEVPASPGVGAADGAEGRLHHGAPLGDGPDVRSAADADGGRGSHRPPTIEQRPEQPATVADERGSQARGVWPLCPRCGKPMVTEGLGTALKPAMELIVLARKPLSEKSVAANVLRWGTGGLNVDGCRVSTSDALGGGRLTGPTAVGNGWDRPWMHDDAQREKYAAQMEAKVDKAQSLGRWPANVILDEAAASLLDEQSGERTGTYKAPNARARNNGLGLGSGILRDGASNAPDQYGDTGGASRFFYTAKADSAERSPNMATRNSHPTVKPLALMAWLVKLVTPPGGIVLDPFLGSGTTALACIGNGFRWVGIEREAEYVAIAEQRIGLLG